MTKKYTINSFNLLVLLSAASIIGTVSCTLNGKPGNEAPYISHSVITGAGSTFANPIYSKMQSEYCTKTGTPSSYQAIGSSGGIKKILNRSVDFGASDGFLSNDDMSMFTTPVVEFPTCLGAVVVSYNLPNIPDLKLTPDIIAGIFLGKITKWNDPLITSENKGAKLPDLAITIVHRSDGSGTTYVFTDYLSKVNTEWRTKIGTTRTVSWPVGVEGDGNEGVASVVKAVNGAVGYIELTYAMQKHVDFAQIKNSSGKYIKASLESTSLAANVDIPADTRISITNSSVADAYPISSFTWIIIYKEQFYNNRTKEEAIDLLKELSWMITDGQQYTSSLYYSPLPGKALAAAQNVLKSVTYQGMPVLK